VNASGNLNDDAKVLCVFSGTFMCFLLRGKVWHTNVLSGRIWSGSWQSPCFWTLQPWLSNVVYHVTCAACVEWWWGLAKCYIQQDTSYRLKTELKWGL